MWKASFLRSFKSSKHSTTDESFALGGNPLYLFMTEPNCFSCGSSAGTGIQPQRLHFIYTFVWTPRCVCVCVCVHPRISTNRYTKRWHSLKVVLPHVCVIIMVITTNWSPPHHTLHQTAFHPPKRGSSFRAHFFSISNPFERICVRLCWALVCDTLDKKALTQITTHSALGPPAAGFVGKHPVCAVRPLSRFHLTGTHCTAQHRTRKS